MDSMLPNGSFFSNMVKALTFFLFIQFTAGTYLDLQIDEHNTIGHVHSESNKTSNDKIELRLIDEEINQLAKIILNRNIESSHFLNHNKCDACDDERKIEEIEKQIRKLQEEISRQKKSTTISEKDRQVITQIEKITKDFQKFIDNMKKEPQEKDKQLAERIKILIEETRMIYEIVDDILASQFSVAEKKLLASDEITIRQVVKWVYVRQIDEINLLSGFGEFVRNVSLKLIIFDVLYDQMRIYRDITVENGDPQNLFRIYESLRKIYHSSTGTIKANSSTLICVLWTDRRKYSENMMLTAKAFSDRYLNKNSWSVAKQLSKDIAEHCKFDYSIIIDFYSVSMRYIGQMSIQSMLGARKQRFHHVIENVAFGDVLFDTLRREGKLSTNDVLWLAHDMRINADHKDFPSLSPDVRSRFENITKQLPVSVKNLFLSSEICLKNTLHNEYLYVDCTEYRTDKNSGHRPIFTWRRKDRFEPPKFKWRVGFSSESSTRVTLTNQAYSTNLEYGRNVKFLGKSRVFAYRGRGSNSYWDIEVDGNVLKFYFNVNNVKKYLIADKEQDKYRRRVFSAPSKEIKNNNKWEISDCSNFS